MTEQQQTRWYQDQMKTRIETAPPSVVDRDVQFITWPTARCHLTTSPRAHIEFTRNSPWLGNPGRSPTSRIWATQFSPCHSRHPACPTDEPLDIGAIQLTSLQKLEVGKPCPVDLVTTAGQPIDQSSWTGKVIVLHPWSLNARQFFPPLNRSRAIQTFKSSTSACKCFSLDRSHQRQTPLPGLLAMDKDSMDTQAASHGPRLDDADASRRSAA